MDEKDFAIRLARLREKKGVSARDMSLSIGQNPGYIHLYECFGLLLRIARTHDRFGSVDNPQVV